MAFAPLIVRLAGLVSSSRTGTAVIPRLAVGQLLQGLVLEVHGAEVILRVRGQEFLARTEVPLTPGTVVALEVTELSPQRLVFRLRTDAAGPSIAAPVDDGDLVAVLRATQTPDTPSARVAARVLLEARQPVRSETLQTLIQTAARLNDASPATLRAALELLRRDLPVVKEAARIARAFQQAPAALGRQLQRLAALLTPRGSAPPLPARIAGALREFMAALPGLRLPQADPAAAARPRQATDARSSTSSNAPAAPAADGPAAGTSDAAVARGRAPVRSTGASENPAADITAAQIRQTRPAGMSGAPRASTSPAAGAAGIERMPPGSLPGTAADAPVPGVASQPTPLAAELRRVLEFAASTPERQLLDGNHSGAQMEMRAAAARLLATVKAELAATQDGALREILREVRTLLARVESGFDAPQLANAAPRPDPAHNVYQFVVPVQTPEGWTSAALAVYRRPEGRPIDPDDFRVAIRLALPNLGEVKVTVGVRRQSVSCAFTCSRPEGLHALERDQAELMDSLRRRDYHPGRFTHALLSSPPPEIEAPAIQPGRLDARA